ncbi:MAG: hypothetical protein ACKO04_11870 [Actinomycetes bacterium]
MRSLRNTEYWVITAGGQDQRVIGDATDLHRLLESELGVRVTPDEARVMYEKAAGRSADRTASSGS